MKKLNIEILNDAIATEFEVPVEVIQPDANILQTLDLDSMRVMSLVVLVKRHTGIMLPIRHLQQFTTFRILYDYIEQHLNTL